MHKHLMALHPVLLVMGVSAVGKSTIAHALANRIGGIYLDADDYHPPENVAAMAAGQPLTDAMRAPWIAILIGACKAARQEAPVVLACSALRRRYRDTLREGLGEIVVIHATASRDALEARILQRKGHYMPATLLQSQIDTLEPPGPDERPITVDAEAEVEAIIDAVVDKLGRGGPAVGS